VKGQNMLRDGGTFSYNSSAADIDYFGGTASHNSAMFDGHGQMPRLGRFLFSRWLSNSPASLTADDRQVTASAGYRDHRGATHHRSILLTDRKLQVTDLLDGSASEAILRWRLTPGNWKFEGNSVQDDARIVRIEAADTDQPAPMIELATGEESRYYGSRSPLPVLEVRTTVPAKIITTIEY
jgi:hypothetical protein